MSDTAQSTVKDFEDDIETTGTDDNHSPIRPENGTAASAGDSDISTLDNHSPILPEQKKKQKKGAAAAGEGEDEGGVKTLDNHSPIAPMDNHSPIAPPKGSN